MQSHSVNPIRDGPAPGAREIVAALRDVTMMFDNYQTRALANVTLEVRRGEVFGLLGPKNSGKTTALQILTGRLRPLDGKAALFGRAPRCARKRVGYLPPPAQEDSRSTGFFSRLGKIFARRKNTLAPAGRRPRLAQMLAKNPDLLILDEPFADLDDAGCREMTGLMLSAARRGGTVIFSADCLSQAKDICDRVAILLDGKIQIVGILDELLAAPDAIRFVAPVLPPATADRILKIIRQDLANSCETPRKQPAAEKPSKTQPGVAPEKILAPLMKTAPEPKAPPAPADPVKHDLLDELTKRPQR